jgi:hypothetical protein
MAKEEPIPLLYTKAGVQKNITCISEYVRKKRKTFKMSRPNYEDVDWEEWESYKARRLAPEQFEKWKMAGFRYNPVPKGRGKRSVLNDDDDDDDDDDDNEAPGDLKRMIKCIMDTVKELKDNIDDHIIDKIMQGMWHV